MHRDLKTVDTVIIHCADTPDGDARFTAVDIDRWHAARGFVRAPEFTRRSRLHHIGYHRVFEVDGRVVLGRDLAEVGAHAQGSNQRSVGLCLIGRSRFTLAQWAALRSEVLSLIKEFGRVAVIGHRDVEPTKTCPSFDVQAWVHGGMTPFAGHVVEA